MQESCGLKMDAPEILTKSKKAFLDDDDENEEIKRGFVRRAFTVFPVDFVTVVLFWVV